MNKYAAAFYLLAIIGLAIYGIYVIASQGG
jgi:hypothetical protein